MLPELMFVAGVGLGVRWYVRRRVSHRAAENLRLSREAVERLRRSEDAP